MQQMQPGFHAICRSFENKLINHDNAESETYLNSSDSAEPIDCVSKIRVYIFFMSIHITCSITGMSYWRNRFLKVNMWQTNLIHLSETLRISWLTNYQEENLMKTKLLIITMTSELMQTPAISQLSLSRKCCHCFCVWISLNPQVVLTCQQGF